MIQERREILGIPVDCVDMTGALAVVKEMMSGNECGAVIAVNPEKIIAAERDAKLLAALKGARLLIPDGIGVVLAARLLGLPRLTRVPGSELMPAICKVAARRGYRVFLFGAKPDVNAEAVERIRKLYPDIRIVGSQHGYVHAEEMPGLFARINASRAEILFVALGSPRQELWTVEALPNLNVRVCQCVGGTLDVIAGRVRRAPKLFRRLNLEWLYRLATNPRRLPRQAALPRFAWRVLLAWVR